MPCVYEAVWTEELVEISHDSTLQHTVEDIAELVVLNSVNKCDILQRANLTFNQHTV